MDLRLIRALNVAITYILSVHVMGSQSVHVMTKLILHLTTAIVHSTIVTVPRPLLMYLSALKS